MRRKNITTLLVLMLVAGAFLYAASGKMLVRYAVAPASVVVSTPSTTPIMQQQSNSPDKRMVDMTADDSYLIEKGDSTIFILVGNFAAHHNGAVILADSAVRYSNQSFECFGNVLINQNSTYIYGERAEYNRNNNTAKVFSKLVKVVDEDAVMYTYNCKFNTAKSEGEFSGGCYVEKEDNLLEAERGFYNTKTHELKAVNRVQMRNNDYEVLSDSVIFNTQTEDAKYFTNTHIWNTNDEYLNTQAGTYTKSIDRHHLTRSSYLLQPEREIWSDSIIYDRTDGHIVARRNIQVDDTTQKILGFADYAEWWDEPGNAFFTRRPSMINYDPELTDSIYLCADTLWMYTIAVEPEVEVEATDTTKVSEGMEPTAEQTTPPSQENRTKTESATKMEGEKRIGNKDAAEGDDKSRLTDRGMRDGSTTMRGEASDKKRDEARERQRGEVEAAERGTERTLKAQEESKRDSASIKDKLDSTSTTAVTDSTIDNDSVMVESSVADTTKYSPKQLRRRAKLERKAERQAIKARERAVRDSLDSLRQIELDSIQTIRDSLLRMKIDTIIAERIERSSRLADEEKARIEKIKAKAEQRRRQKIDKAKARALKRGKEYTGEDYDPNAPLVDSTPSPRRPMADTTTTSGRDTMASDTTHRDTTPLKRVIPDDSVYKMIKAYRNVKMFRSESQMICDSLVTLNTDSIIRMYIRPVMWNDNNQILSDSAMIHTKNQKISKAKFMGAPIMGIEIDTTYYNQVKGKEMTAYFDNGQVYRNDVDGNAQTIYYLQEDEDVSSEVTALMYIESSSISFYLSDGEMDKIVYKQNPEYHLYPMNMVPDNQQRKLDGFEWQSDKRPTREVICNRRIRSSNRGNIVKISKPTFPIVERINYDRRRLVENRMWKDRVDKLSPEIIEWRNSCPSYKNRRK